MTEPAVIRIHSADAVVIARAIADHFKRDVHSEALATCPNVDGVIAPTHGAGCATDSTGGTRKTVPNGIELVPWRLKDASKGMREPVSARDLRR